MNILFDHQTFSIQSYGGISRYFERLVTGINATDHQATIALWRSDNRYINQAAPFRHARFKGRGRLLYAVNKQFSQRAIQRGQFDLLHATYYDPYFLGKLAGKPFVMTIHDMTHERLHEQFRELQPDQYVIGKRQLAQQAAAIITVSEFTRQDVISLLHIDPSRVHVVHHASSLACQVQDSPLRLRTEYLLFVGNRGHYKNFSRFLKAFALLTDFPELKLICAGGGAFTSTERIQLAESGLTNRVSQVTFEDDQALANLYASATAFVFPSLYEGFGIPILEAYSCGCPCVLSEVSSFPEVAQDAALYFDPRDPNNMAQAIKKLLVDPFLRNSLIEKGYQRFKAFTWQKSVDQTLAIYRTVLAIHG